MPSEEKQIIAFLFKRSGEKELKLSDAQLTLSMELNWFSPEDAKKFINIAIKNKLLEKEGDIIQPSFDIDAIDIPLGFYPSIDINKIDLIKEVPVENNLVFEEILEKIKSQGKENDETILKRINQIKEEKKTNREVAAVYVAKENNIDIKESFDKIQNSIFTKNTK